MQQFRNLMMLMFLPAFISIDLFAQPQSAIEFYDSTGTNATAKFGWSGDAAGGNFYIETPNDGEPVKVKQGNVTVDGNVTAASFTGDGRGLTGISSGIDDNSVTTGKIADKAVTDSKIDSVSWSKIKGMPAGFTDGVDDEGTGTGTISDGSITAAKLADSAVTTAKVRNGSITDDKIDSVSWSKINGMPAGFADGTDDIGGGVSLPLEIVDVNGLTDSLNAKAATAHTHSTYASTNHNHSVSDINGLQDSLSQRSLVSHTHSGYASATHDHNALYYTKAETDQILGADNGSWAAAAGTALLIDAAKSVCSVTISAPSSGYVLVWANASVSPNDGLYCAINGAISATQDAQESFYYTIHWPASSQYVSNTLSTSNLFAVTAGTKTFYLNLWKAAGNPTTARANIVALFVKNQL
jgi:hypothetical protein